MAVVVPPGLGRAVEPRGQPRRPSLRGGHQLNDPREPFSPNYGPPPVKRAKPAIVARRFDLDEIEARNIIARAVIEEELRAQR